MKKDYDEFEYDHKPRHCERPDFPHFCPEDRPEHRRKPIPPMPPVPSVVTGMDLYEAMNSLSDRVNVCIDTYNSVMAENYRTLHNMQRAAEENGAYYDPHSVWVEEGYYADESSTYHLIHKSCVDSHGEPIRMQLHLAYGNTTNSMIEQPIFASSKVAYADKMVVAIPKTEKGWYGKAIYHGCPIASADEPELYTVGFTKSGAMRVYNNGVSVDQMVRDTVVDAMGCSGVLIQNGQITDEAYRKNIPNADEQISRVVMGQVGETREVVILTVGNENDVNRKGLTSLACANILKQYGCDIAVELCEGEGSGAVDKGSLMYEPDGDVEPSAYAYWFISRKCFYKNDYERELAELVQNYGACIWQGFLNKKNIANVKAELDAEIDRAKSEEARLDTKIDDETDRAKAEEARLNQKIDDETARAEEAERVLQDNIDKEQARAEEVETTLGKKIDGEIERATSNETRIETKLDAEIERAEAADKKLTEDLDTEVHRATNEEAVLHQEILTEQGARISADTTLQTNINNEASKRSDGDSVLQQNIDSLSSRVTECENNISNLQTITVSLQNQMSSLDKTVVGMVTTISDVETGFNELKSVVVSMQTTVNNLSGQFTELDTNVKKYDSRITNLESDVANIEKDVENIIEGSTSIGYVKLSGDTMTGVLNMSSHVISGLSNGIANTDAVNVSQLNYESNRAKAAETKLTESVNNIIEGSTDLEYVKKTGDTMSGVLNMSGNRISNVSSATDNADAVNLSQLNDLSEKIDKIVAGDVDLTGYVKKSGDTMTGVLGMGEHKITGVADGEEDKDAVNVSQLGTLRSAITAEANRAESAESSIKSSYVKKTGDTMSGSLSMGSNRITDTSNGVNDNDVVNMSQLSAENTRATSAENSIVSSLTASDNLRFKFATDGEGNYGYLGADDSFIPFKSGAGEYAYGCYAFTPAANTTYLIPNGTLNQHTSGIKIYDNMIDVTVSGKYLLVSLCVWTGSAISAPWARLYVNAGYIRDLDCTLSNSFTMWNLDELTLSANDRIQIQSGRNSGSSNINISYLLIKM